MDSVVDKVRAAIDATLDSQPHTDVLKFCSGMLCGGILGISSFPIVVAVCTGVVIHHEFTTSQEYTKEE